MNAPGALAIVLHTHMPYVEGGGEWPNPNNPPNSPNWEGFGAWPFGEEWLWEAIATSYLPVLGVLGRAPVTLSLTPVLCDQLEARGAVERCVSFLEEIRPESHRRDIAGFREGRREQLAAELERSAAEYASAAQQLARSGTGPRCSRLSAGMRRGRPQPPTPCCRCSRRTRECRSRFRPASSPIGAASVIGREGSGCRNVRTCPGLIHCLRRPGSATSASS